VFQPDHFCAAEERQGLQRLDRRSNSPAGLIGVICDAVDYFQAKIPGIVRHEFLRQLRCELFYFSFIRADDRIYVCGLRFCFRLRHRRFLACGMKVDKVDRLVLKTMEPARPRAVSSGQLPMRAVNSRPEGGPSPFTNALRTTRSTTRANDAGRSCVCILSVGAWVQFSPDRCRFLLP